MPSCPSCGQENPEIARFCFACATPLPSAQAQRDERKVVTVVFADLVGFTSRADGMDPEDVQALLVPYHARLRAELERFGGTVEKFIGDAVMALFGAPVSREGDPERAVRAALAIRDWVRGLDEELQVRIAANTGEALVSIAADASAGETMAAGDVVNTAARLQTAAPVNGVIVGEETYRATRHVIAYREAEPVVAKGKARPVPVWEAVAVRSETPGARTHRTPFVGRHRELESLEAALSDVRDSHSARLATLMAGPGQGKSRLVHEFRTQAAQATWLEGHCVPYGTGVTFWALGEIVKAYAGILEGEPATTTAEKLERAVREALRDDREAEWVRGHLRTLVGLASESGSWHDRRSEAFFAWRRFLQALAEVRPLVLVFEDLHWADDDLLDFIDHVLEWASDVPLLLVCTARPELLESRPGWGANRQASSLLRLSALSDEDVEQIVSALLGNAILLAETQAALLERAGGNPLYAEQYTRLFLERGRVEGLQPVTLQGLIAARLDALATADKELLHAAAVIGKVFWTGSVTAVAGRDRWSVDERLRVLEHRELVRRSRVSSLAGDTEWAFGHALVRDVAYGQIPRADRAEKHRITGEWIESLGRPDDHVEMVAHHYLSALKLSPDAALAERARFALRGAGDRAFALNAFATAGRLYRKALELWPTDDPERPRLELRYGRALYRGEGAGAEAFAAARDGLLAAGNDAEAAEAEIMLAELASYAGDHDRASDHLERAVELIEPGPASAAKAFVFSRAARLELLRASLHAAIALGRQAFEIASSLDLDEIRVHALNTVGTARVEQNELAGLEDVERSLTLARRINSPESVRAYLNLSVLTAMSGDLSRSFSVQSEGLREAERLGVDGWHRFLRAHSVQYAYWSGRWDDALVCAEEFLTETEAGSPHYEENQNRNVRALVRLARGDLEGALADTTRSVVRARQVKDAQNLCPTLAVRAFVLLSAGDPDAARDLAREVVAGWGGVEDVVLTWGGVGAVAALDALGDVGPLRALEEGRSSRSPWLAAALAFVDGDYEGASEIYAAMGSLPDAAYAQLRAGARSAVEGRTTDAEAQVEKALSFYHSVGATRYIRAGEAQLAARA
ncbi:MAG TPA: AAA family ATPase [Gaiellaceae bacterium]|nr:AAA family ATPase [Gaiellaceae bacterium]